jgi:hypothetical protein
MISERVVEISLRDYEKSGGFKGAINDDAEAGDVGDSSEDHRSSTGAPAHNCR